MFKKCYLLGVLFILIRNVFKVKNLDLENEKNSGKLSHHISLIKKVIISLYQSKIIIEKTIKCYSRFLIFSAVLLLWVNETEKGGFKYG